MRQNFRDLGRYAAFPYPANARHQRQTRLLRRRPAATAGVLNNNTSAYGVVKCSSHQNKIENPTCEELTQIGPILSDSCSNPKYASIPRMLRLYSLASRFRSQGPNQLDEPPFPPPPQAHRDYTGRSILFSCAQYNKFATIMGLSPKDCLQLKEALQTAVVKCSERCLYQSAKWYGEAHPRCTAEERQLSLVF